MHGGQYVLKRPLNALEAPVYPEFKARMPIFRWAGKNWKAKAGEIVRDTEHDQNLYSYAVLTQPRDYNQRVYGISSERDPVNLNFRPPLRTMEDDLPLSRQPRPLVVPRINPGLSGDGGQLGWGVQNMSISGMEKFLTDRVKGLDIFPTAHCPYEIGLHDGLYPTTLPDLEVHLPLTNVGMNDALMLGRGTGGYTADAPPDMGVERFTREEDKLQLAGDPGRSYGGFTVNGMTGLENLELDRKLPEHSLHSGINPQYTVTPLSGLENTTLERNIPGYSVTAGANAGGLTLTPTSGFENIQLETKLMPHYETGVNTKAESPLDYRTPTGALTSRVTDYSPTTTGVSYTIPGESRIHDEGNVMRQKINFHEKWKGATPNKFYNGGRGAGVSAPPMREMAQPQVRGVARTQGKRTYHIGR